MQGVPCYPKIESLVAKPYTFRKACLVYEVNGYEILAMVWNDTQGLM